MGSEKRAHDKEKKGGKKGFGEAHGGMGPTITSKLIESPMSKHVAAKGGNFAGKGKKGY